MINGRMNDPPLVFSYLHTFLISPHFVPGYIRMIPSGSTFSISPFHLFTLSPFHLFTLFKRNVFCFMKKRKGFNNIFLGNGMLIFTIFGWTDDDVTG